MATKPPSAADLRAKLAGMTASEMRGLADKSGVPFDTVRRLRYSDNPNPRLDTLERIWPHIARRKT
jgi:hypothetical protein